MDPEELSFIKAICTDPADDTVRLVYADWLDDHQRYDRAEFIRVQVELASLCAGAAADTRTGAGEGPHGVVPPVGVRKRVDTLRRRERELLGAGHREWLPRGPFAIRADVNHPLNITCDFTRGFVSHVTAIAADFLAHADALVWQAMVKCVRCGGTGLFGGYTAEANPGQCDRCEGTGRAPNPTPCPPTAQPIERVTFSRARGSDWLALGRGTLSTGDNTWKFDRWPDIEFKSPGLVERIGDLTIAHR